MNEKYIVSILCRMETGERIIKEFRIAADSEFKAIKKAKNKLYEDYEGDLIPCSIHCNYQRTMDAGL